MPLNQAFQFVGLSLENPSAQGDKKSAKPIKRLTTSAVASFFQVLFMAQLLTFIVGCISQTSFMHGLSTGPGEGAKPPAEPASSDKERRFSERYYGHFERS